ncbi:MAG: hypothetical protein KBS76_04110, partial [Ruminococcus sp.]|nr:hypothetical protein [Candidatus Apopatosoma intestinale]
VSPSGLGHASALTTIQVVIHSLGAASLPKGEGYDMAVFGKTVPRYFFRVGRPERKNYQKERADKRFRRLRAATGGTF